MTDSEVIKIAVQTMLVVAKVSAPILIVSMGVGLGISLVQSATQVQEFTLTFVPKLIAVAIVIAVAGNWMLHELVSFTEQMFELIPSLIR